MIKAIILTLSVVFAVLGLCDFIHTVKSVMLYSGVKTDNYSVLFLKSGYAISQLRYCSYKLRWYGSEFCDRVIAVKDDLTDTELAECEQFCYLSRIYLCNFSEIEAVINSFKAGEISGKQY